MDYYGLFEYQTSAFSDPHCTRRVWYSNGRISVGCGIVPFSNGKTKWRPFENRTFLSVIQMVSSNT